MRRRRACNDVHGCADLVHHKPELPRTGDAHAALLSASSLDACVHPGAGPPIPTYYISASAFRRLPGSPRPHPNASRNLKLLRMRSGVLQSIVHHDGAPREGPRRAPGGHLY
ncbi:hypothetical protein T492DRAFT_1021199 [Pavlovales sp. CCMP2436]|nr:hypothetical protein T492DRAFT_1021199 [Pavlovales sp. CCMP2436]